MKWVLFSMMRRQSERLPDKMLKRIWTPIGHVSLAQWAAHRLSDMSKTLDLDYRIGVAQDEFPMLTQSYWCIWRSPDSLTADTVAGLQRDIPPRFDCYDWALHVNACCPLLTTQTVKTFIDEVSAKFDCDEPYGIQPAFEENGFVYADGERLYPPIGEQLSLDTKKNKPFFIPCHAFSAFPAKRVGRSLAPTGGYVSVGKRRSEFLDIDTADDLEIVAAFSSWRYRQLCGIVE